MGLKSPDITATTKPVTLLRRDVTELPGYQTEIIVRADNLGAQKWAEMLTETKNDGKERALNVFRNSLTGNFTAGNIVTGTAIGFKTGEDIPIETSDIGLKGIFSDHVVNVHTHPLTEEDAHLKTSLPSGNDIRGFLEHRYSARVIIDRGGAHLLIRTRNKTTDELPPSDFMQKKVDEIARKNGTVSDIQKKLNGMISQYGLQYFYTEDLAPNKDGMITFRTP